VGDRLRAGVLVISGKPEKKKKNSRRRSDKSPAGPGFQEGNLIVIGRNRSIKADTPMKQL